MGVPQVAGAPLPRTLSADAPPGRGDQRHDGGDRCWRGEDPVGRRIKLTSYDQPGPWFTVVGVVGDTRHTGLDSSLRPQVYVEQRVDPSPQMVVVLRASGDPLGYAAVARAAVLEADRDQPVGRMRTMRSVVAESVSNRRFTMALVATFAVLAFALSLVGLYAVVSHSVAERTREMGVRLALGASPAAMLRLVLGEGLALAGMGVALGLIGAFLVTRFMAAMLFGVQAHDTLTFVLVPVLLFIAAAAGCLVPARRAMRVNPITALRAESGRPGRPARPGSPPRAPAPRRCWADVVPADVPVELRRVHQRRRLLPRAAEQQRASGRRRRRSREILERPQPCRIDGGHVPQAHDRRSVAGRRADRRSRVSLSVPPNRNGPWIRKIVTYVGNRLVLQDVDAARLHVVRRHLATRWSSPRPAG